MFKDINLNKKYSKEFGKRRKVSIETGENLYKSNHLCVRALDYGFVSNNALESTRQTIRRLAGKEGKIFIRIYPHINLTMKPAEVRMGHGKGGRSRGWFSYVCPGDVLIEVNQKNNPVMKDILKKSCKKLGVRVYFSNALSF